MIRVAVLYSLYSSKHASGCSRHNFYRQLIKAINARHPGEFQWLFPVPSPESGIGWDPIDDPSVQVIPVLGSGQDSKTDAFSGYDGAMPHPAFLAWFRANADRIDVVLNSDYLYSGLLDLLTKYESSWFWMLPKVVRPIVVGHVTESGRDTALPHLAGNECRLAMLAPAMRSAPFVVFAEQDKAHIQRAAADLLSPFQRAKLSIRVVPPLIETKALLARKAACEAEREAVRRERGTVFFHGGTFEAKRHIPDLEKFVETVASMGHQASLLLASQKEKSGRDWSALTTVRYSVMHDAFVQMFGQAHVSLCYNDYEGTGLSYFETLFTGMIGVFMRADWLKGRVPDDYPFLVSGKREFVAAMTTIAMDYGAAKAKAETLLAKLEVTMGQDIVADRYVAVLRDAMAAKRAECEMLAGTHVLMRTAKAAIANLAVGQEFTVDEAKAWFQKPDALKPRVLRNLLVAAGAEDVNVDSTRYRRLA